MTWPRGDKEHKSAVLNLAIRFHFDALQGWDFCFIKLGDLLHGLRWLVLGHAVLVIGVSCRVVRVLNRTILD